MRYIVDNLVSFLRALFDAAEDSSLDAFSPFFCLACSRFVHFTRVLWVVVFVLLRVTLLP